MPIFTCDKCECQTNTALDTNYWVRGQDLFPPEIDNLKLCGLCVPDVFKDNTKNVKMYNLARGNGWVLERFVIEKMPKNSS